MSSKGAGGYAGKLLSVDLTKEKLTEERLDEAVLRKYVGGADSGARLTGFTSPTTHLHSTTTQNSMHWGGSGGMPCILLLIRDRFEVSKRGPAILTSASHIKRDTGRSLW